MSDNFGTKYFNFGTSILRIIFDQNQHFAPILVFRPSNGHTWGSFRWDGDGAVARKKNDGWSFAHNYIRW